MKKYRHLFDATLNSVTVKKGKCPVSGDTQYKVYFPNECCTTLSEKRFHELFVEIDNNANKKDI